MLRPFENSNQLVPEDWYLDLPPAELTVYNLKTERQVREPSLIAVTHSQPDKLAAVGREALRHKDDPDAVVFSPFRQGQIAHFPAAAALIKALFRQIGLGAVLIPKPVMCVHIQEHTTQVEQQALGEAAILCGAQKVFFYTDSLPAMVDCARNRADLRHTVLIHIEP